MTTTRTGTDRYVFRDRCRQRATSWKAHTPTLPDDARLPARWMKRPDLAIGAPVGFCLPPAHARHNLLPGVRGGALRLFRELDIPWHAGIGGGPGNHLLSSQVQCVNALYDMIESPERIKRAFRRELDIGEVLQIEPGRFLTFEYIGPDDVLNESPGRPRRRGTMTTSCDAAFLYESRTGAVELALVEWKYTEEYQTPRPAEPAKDRTRESRYRHLVEAPDGPIDGSLLPFSALLDEPLYQLMRQQLFAYELQKRRAHGADRVRVVHVLPPENTAYQDSLTTAHRTLGDTVGQVWGRLLRDPDLFVHMNPAVFLDEDVTSAEYCARYDDRTPNQEMT